MIEDCRDIRQAIRQRHSVRTFTDEALTPQQTRTLEAAIAATAVTPFGSGFTLRLTQTGQASDMKPSTYGFISRAPAYLLLGTSDDAASQLAGAYALERVVLAATALGLGTCWIGGTFKAASFGSDALMPGGRRLRIVSPVGSAARPRLVERMGKAMMHSTRRNDFGELFFNGDFDTALAPDAFPAVGQALEMVRLAPSARNAQPWRAVVTDGGRRVDFFHRPGAFTCFDMGIALCHFALSLPSAAAFGRAGITYAVPSGLHYITSARL